jgi:hypothetical protein
MKMWLLPVLILLVLALLLPATATARLGETEDQCEVRYGAPTTAKDVVTIRQKYGTPQLEVDKKQLYNKGGAEIIVGFIDGKAASIQYYFARKDALSKEEILQLLRINAPESTWFYDLNHPFGLTGPAPEGLHEDGGVLWTEDGSLFASFRRRTPMISIWTSGLRATLPPSDIDSPSLQGF